MIFNILRILLIFILWWAALWFVLPADWLQTGPLSLVALHVVPPLLVSAAWSLFKRARVWHATRAEKAAADKEAAHQQELDRNRAHVECCGIGMALSKSPDWMDEYAPQCVLIKENNLDIRKAGREAALIASLEQVFLAAFGQCEATVWLPVRLAHEGIPADWIETAWKQAAESCGIVQRPASPDCQLLPGTGSVTERVIDLFENAPTFPAVLVLSLDSPLAGAPEPTRDAGHAVLALLLSRPGLAALDIGPIDFDGSEAEDDPYTPYWERNFGHDTSALPWRIIPPSLRLDFLSRCTSVATLHRPAHVTEPASGRTLKRQIRDVILESCVRAGLRDASFKEEFDPDDETNVLEIGWLVHDSSDIPRFAALTSALADCGCELNPIGDASKLQDEFGNVGVAREVLMLAVSMIRAVQLNKPVLLAGFGEGEIALGVSKAVDIGA